MDRHDEHVEKIKEMSKIGLTLISDVTSTVCPNNLKFTSKVAVNS